MTIGIERLTVALADRYRLERELGAGGMATVYLAEDLKHKRRVAVKVLKPELAAVLGAERFVHEITTTAALQHPHILPLFDSGEADGFLYYVMPFIDGETLRAKLDRETQLGIDESVRIASDVASALHYAHQHGVIHRDIKPENILLHDGRPMVADFGIALAVSAAAGGRMTETGLSLGTPHYMSPEQATAEKEITGRSDVYSLGSVLYEMLTGNPPHTGASAQQIIMKIIVEPVEVVTKHRKSVPPNVAAAVAKSLEKLPADRFESAKAFAEALANPGFATTTTTAPGTAGSQSARWAMGTGGVLVGALLGAAAMQLLGRNDPTTTSALATSSQLTFDGRSHYPAIAPDGESVAFLTQRCPFRSEVTCPQSLIVQERTSGRQVEVLTQVVMLRAPRWTADGRSLVISARLDSARVGLFVVPRLGGVPRSLGASGMFDTHATADSVLVVRTVAGSGEQVAYVLSTETGAVHDTIPLGVRTVSDVAWSPNGKYLAVTSEFESLFILDRDGQVTDSLIVPVRRNVRWTPDGRALLAFHSLPVKEDHFIRYQIDDAGRIGNETILMHRVNALLEGGFDVARHSGRMAFMTGILSMDLWTFALPPAPPETVQRTSGTTYYGDPDISSDGARLYYQRGDAHGDNLHQLTIPDTEEALWDQTFPAGHSNVRVSRDNRRVIFSQFDTAGFVLFDLNVASRLTRSMRIDRRWVGPDAPRPVGAQQLVFLSRDGDKVIRMDSIGGAMHELALPDSLTAYGFDLSADGEEALLLLASGGEAVLGITPLSTWSLREVMRFEPTDAPQAMSWAADGWIYLATSNDRESGTITRVREGQSVADRVGTLPPGCTAQSMSVASKAPIGTCARRDTRSDIWLVELPDLLR